MLFLLLVCIQTVRQADNLRGSCCKREEGRGGREMPCVYISTNVCLDGVELEPIFDEITKAVASIIGKPQRYVMVILKGSLAMKFWGNKEAAAFGEVVSMGGINTQVKRELISTLGAILQDKLSIPTARFVLKVTDTTAGSKSVSKL